MGTVVPMANFVKERENRRTEDCFTRGTSVLYEILRINDGEWQELF